MWTHPWKWSMILSPSSVQLFWLRLPLSGWSMSGGAFVVGLLCIYACSEEDYDVFGLRRHAIDSSKAYLTLCHQTWSRLCVYIIVPVKKVSKSSKQLKWVIIHVVFICREHVFRSMWHLKWSILHWRPILYIAGSMWMYPLLCFGDGLQRTHCLPS